MNVPLGRTLSRRGLLSGALGVCIAAAGDEHVAAMSAGQHTSTRARRAAVDPNAAITLPTERPLVGLTFDDGPDPAYTPHVLDVLARYGVTATFFAIGRNLAAFPDLAARVVAEGHELANHTADHLWLDALPAAAVGDQLDRGTAAVRRVGGPASPWFRPPRGWTSETVVAQSTIRRLRTAYWSDCIEAHSAGTPARTAAAIADAAEPGRIVLGHDGGHLTGPNPQSLDRSHTVETLPLLLAAFVSRGLRPVSLGELARG